MTLEKNLKNFGRGVLGAILAGTLVFCQNGTTSTKDEKEEPIPPVSTLIIKGKVLIPKVENNQIVWYGQPNAKVSVEDLETISSGSGEYLLEGVSMGTHTDLLAKYNYTHESRPRTVYCFNTTVADLELIPNSISSQEIVYGIIYDDATLKTTYNGKLNVNYVRSGSGGEVPGDVEQSTEVTNGIYAFQGTVDEKFLTTTEEGGVTRRVRLLPAGEEENEHYKINLDERYSMLFQEAYVE